MRRCRVLFQHGRVDFPGTGAFFENVAARASSFGLSLLRTGGLVTDWGLQARLVGYIARQTRTQLSVLLAGRGYFDVGGRTVLLGPGDFVLSDQREHGDEGYAGDPAEILIADWEGDGPLGPRHEGAARCGRARPRELAALRDLALRARTTAVDAWAAETTSVLRAMLGAPSIFDASLLAGPEHVRPIFAELAIVRERLSERPALFEIADRLGVSERQARRAFDELDRSLGVGVSGWRDFLSDTRLAFAQQLLSVPGLGLGRVAALSGFGSSIALCHAFSERGTTPGRLARTIRERWGTAAELDGAAERDPADLALRRGTGP